MSTIGQIEVPSIIGSLRWFAAVALLEMISAPGPVVRTCRLRQKRWAAPTLGVRAGNSGVSMVYSWCMARTNIDIDEDACREVMDRYDLATKREAVNLALRRLAGEALSLDDARALRGSGWDGDLEELRTTRTQ